MNDELEYIKNAFTQVGDNTNLEVDQLNVSCITSKNNHFSLDSDGTLTVQNLNVATGVLSYQSILDFIYPIGSIYMSVNNINPNIIFGGVWEVWANGRVPVGIDPTQTEFDTTEKMGGQKSVALTLREMPKHTHQFVGNALAPHGHSASGSTTGGDHRHNYQHVECSKSTSSGTYSVLRPYGYLGNGIVSAGEAGTGNHTHNLSIAVNQASAGTPNGNNDEVGSNQSHNNLQPYITCYMWKRTA